MHNELNPIGPLWASSGPALAAQSMTLLFLLFLIATYATRVWLAMRQIRHVAMHRDAVPDKFNGRVSPDAHRKAADYTIAKVKFGLFDLLLGVLVLLAFTLFGGLHWLNQQLLSRLDHGIAYQLALIVAVALIGSVIDLPLSWYRQFRLEQRFGFNRMTMRLWLIDLLKGSLLSALIGLPLIAAILWTMGRAGALWWFWAWGLWTAFSILALVLYPTVIAPLFNKFQPLPHDALRTRIEALMQRCGFRASGLFVMDGSKRSAHGNAYFTGLGAAKRIVFFDTLLTRLQAEEIEAVLAHELGHFKLRHIAKRIGISFAVSLAFFALLGWLATQTWFYVGLGVTPAANAPNDALALVLFFFALPVFTFLFTPISSWFSRRHEFEADAFAARQADASALISALVKLYEDNASTLTPDRVYSAFYDSHPPASIRIARLSVAP